MPNRSAWPRNCHELGPHDALGKAGKFSTSVVIMSCPPGSTDWFGTKPPSMRTGPGSLERCRGRRCARRVRSR